MNFASQKKIQKASFNISSIKREQEESIRQSMKIYQRIYWNEDDLKIWVNRWAENVRIIADYRKSAILDIGKVVIRKDNINYLKLNSLKSNYEKS